MTLLLITTSTSCSATLAVTDYLRQKVFAFPTAPGPDGRQVAQVPPGFFLSNGGSSSSGSSSSNADGSGGSSSSSSGEVDSGGSSSSGGGASSHELVTVWRDNVS